MDFHSPMLYDGKKARRHFNSKFGSGGHGQGKLLTKTRLIIFAVVVLGVVLLSRLSIASASNVSSVVVCPNGASPPGCTMPPTVQQQTHTAHQHLNNAAVHQAAQHVVNINALHNPDTKTGFVHARHAVVQSVMEDAKAHKTHASPSALHAHAHVVADDSADHSLPDATRAGAAHEPTAAVQHSTSNVPKQRTTTQHHKHNNSHNANHGKHAHTHTVRLPAWAWGVGGLALGSVATAIFAAATAPPQVPLTPMDDLEYLMSFQRPLPKRGPTFEELAPPTPIASPNTTRSWSGVVRERSVV